jgi:hypothetical protein
VHRAMHHYHHHHHHHYLLRISLQCLITLSFQARQIKKEKLIRKVKICGEK